jgi:hypothetical protein
MADAPRRIWLCADDYGMAPGVNEAIRALIEKRRLNATSVMVTAPSLTNKSAQALSALNAGGKRAALGLHVTLTAPFSPVTDGFTPLRDDAFPATNEMMRLAMTRRLSSEKLTAEIGTQLRLFKDAFGCLPDFFDGHQHVHLFPQVREALLKVVAESAPRAWVRQCGRARGARRWRDRKGLVLDLLSVRFRAKAARLGIATNPAFAGSYDFTPQADYAALFPRFLDGLPDGGLVMCHPGVVDQKLKDLDSLTDLRERELAYFESDEFARALAERGLALAQPAP